MSHFILGDTDSPQAVDAEAVASVQMRKNRGVFQLVFISAAGVMLGLYAVPRVSDAGIQRSDSDYKRHADDEFRKALEILRSEKPKARQEIHNFTGFDIQITPAEGSDANPNPEPDAPPEPDEES